MKLDIGAGKVGLRGFTGVDKYVGTAAVQADATVLPFPPDSVEEVYCSHTLEHLSYADAPKALAEMMRVLEPGGRATVVVPNMDFVAAVWLHGGDRSYAKQIVFGSQEHEGEFHRNGWRAADLRADMEAAGFEVGTCEVSFTPEYSQESIIAKAIKP
ncbi:MAG: class I SAM-dependent methyltransferase [Limnohabitans sp.]